jgi:hypothetical protein
MYKRDRADCMDYVLKTIGNRYSQPGWWGLGGLIVSAIREQENKTNPQESAIWRDENMLGRKKLDGAIQG